MSAAPPVVPDATEYPYRWRVGGHRTVELRDAIAIQSSLRRGQDPHAIPENYSSYEIIDPPAPVPATWFREFLVATGLTAPRVARLLRHEDDRLARRWKAGQATPPWAAAELLAAWATSRPPRLDPP